MFRLSRRDAEIVINRANQLGIRVGNDPANFVGLDRMTEHLRNDSNPNTVHAQLDAMGLESSELSGPQRAQFKALQDKLADAPLQTRLDALPDFVSIIAEPSIEVARGLDLWLITLRLTKGCMQKRSRMKQQERLLLITEI